jgi:hypothetical protein
MYVGRDTTSQYQELTVDLQRLRSLLEDAEEHIAEDVALDISTCQISIQILQCRAILRGLNVNLEYLRFSAQKQRDVQPGNASIAPLSSPSEISREGLTTATNVTARLQNSSRMIRLSSRRQFATSNSSRQRAKDSEREPNQSSRSSCRTHALSPMPADWQSPFSLPDPLTFDDSRACTILMDPRVRPIIPEIVVNTCGTADNDVPISAETANENLPLEVDTLVSEDCSTNDSERRHSEDSVLPPSARREGEIEIEVRAGPACTMYVLPYRPWYETVNKMDSRLDLYSVQESSDSQYEMEATAIKTAVASTELITE